MEINKQTSRVLFSITDVANHAKKKLKGIYFKNSKSAFYFILIACQNYCKLIFFFVRKVPLIFLFSCNTIIIVPLILYFIRNNNIIRSD